jgi:hypothetical protein
MTLDLSALEALKDARPRKKSTTREWSPLTLDTLHPGTYLAADPSVTAFGLTLFEVSPEHRYAVHFAQSKEIPQTEHTSHEDLLQRVKSLEEWLHAYVAHWVNGTDWGHVRAVHEAPPMGRGKLIKPEISLLTSNVWRNATWGIERLPMVRRQDHAWLLCGNANAKTKKEYHTPLRALFPQIRGSELITNEATRDALSVAIFAAHRGY